MYTIKISYTTGNSFHTVEKEDTLGYLWEKEEDANIALDRIIAHYRAYSDATGYSHSCRKKPTGKEPWFHKGEWEDDWQYRVKVPDGDGGEISISAFWCGYFETLNSAEVTIGGKRWRR